MQFLIKFISIFLLTSSLILVTYSLKCYTGFKFIRGQGFGGESKQCESEGDYCYNMTADGGMFINVAKAGCSTYRCWLSKNKCINTEFQGIPVSFCCCSEDFCNGQD
uniref:Activin_recp domain-containing protein n=1 Tax=Ditylenchus dipsaci TaxID=166011 RepID=A0A915ELA4_9BILA